MSMQTVTREQLIRLVLDLPQEQLAAAFEYLQSLEEDDEDLAAVDAMKSEPPRPFKEFADDLKREHLYP